MSIQLPASLDPMGGYPPHPSVRAPSIHPVLFHGSLCSPFCVLPPEELLRSEHLGPSELEAPAPGGSSEDKSGLQPLDAKDGALTQTETILDFGTQAPGLNSHPVKSGGVLATTVRERGWKGAVRLGGLCGVLGPPCLASGRGSPLSLLSDAPLPSLFHPSCLLWLPADTPVALPKGECLTEQPPAIKPL